MSASAYPARPASEVEWEELLVRYEIAPRALALALADAVGDSGEEATRLLRTLADQEVEAGVVLEAMRSGQFTLHRAEWQPGADAAAFAALFTEWRRRNFAALQRRGLEVWEWRAQAPGQGEITAHQLLCQALEQDAAALAGLRRALWEAPAC
jgi:hypothetical protein